MNFCPEIAALFRRDLRKLALQIRAYPTSDLLWAVPGTSVANSAGNLALHLEGNLREYVGRQLGGHAYERKRDLEFSTQGLDVEAVAQRIDALMAFIPDVIATLDADRLDAVYPQNVLGVPASTRQFLIHLHGHLNYHLGQIDVLRRVLTGGGALAYPSL
jgi:uncharacterized damage-inducible protein DinB